MEHGRNTHDSQSVGGLIEILESEYSWNTFESESKSEIALPVASQRFHLKHQPRTRAIVTCS
jgi:hypothetical protein